MFPSKTVKEWLKKVRKDIENIKQPKGLDDDLGVCECEFIHRHEEGRLLADVSDAQLSGTVTRWFWSVLIDQTLEAVTADRGRKGWSKKDTDLYAQFRKVYPFPKLYCHVHSGFEPATNAILVQFGNALENKKTQPTQKELLAGKKVFWGDVSKWLAGKGRRDLVTACEKKIKKDMIRKK